MSTNLAMVEAKLPPGFRFHPRDEELVCDYLIKKLRYSSCGECSDLLIEVDLNKCEPWDIPETARAGGKEWYFYSQRDRKYATGLRTNRATVSGYWKATGKDKAVFRRGNLVGMRKTLVFHQGRAPKGRKTNWVMHEFRLDGPLAPPKISSLKEDWVLCRVVHKSSEGAAKQVMGSGYDHHDISSASSLLPPLMDSNYNITTFDQTPHEHEQVPCFSNVFPPNQINPTFSRMDPSKISTPTTFGSNNIPESSRFSWDKNVIKTVVNHLAKMEYSCDPNHDHLRGSPSLDEGLTSESFLSDVDFPTMWELKY